MAKMHPRKRNRKKAKEAQKRKEKKDGTWVPSPHKQCGTGQRNMRKRTDRERRRIFKAKRDKELQRKRRKTRGG